MRHGGPYRSHPLLDFPLSVLHPKSESPLASTLPPCALPAMIQSPDAHV